MKTLSRTLLFLRHPTPLIPQPFAPSPAIDSHAPPNPQTPTPFLSVFPSSINHSPSTRHSPFLCIPRLIKYSKASPSCTPSPPMSLIPQPFAPSPAIDSHAPPNPQTPTPFLSVFPSSINHSPSTRHSPFLCIPRLIKYSKASPSCTPSPPMSLIPQPSAHSRHQRNASPLPKPQRPPYFPLPEATSFYPVRQT